MLMSEEIVQGFTGIMTITAVVLLGFVLIPMAEVTMPEILNGPFRDSGLELIHTINLLPGLVMGGLIGAICLVLMMMQSGFGVR